MIKSLKTIISKLLDFDPTLNKYVLLMVLYNHFRNCKLLKKGHEKNEYIETDYLIKNGCKQKKETENTLNSINNNSLTPNKQLFSTYNGLGTGNSVQFGVNSNTLFGGGNKSNLASSSTKTQTQQAQSNKETSNTTRKNSPSRAGSITGNQSTSTKNIIFKSINNKPKVSSEKEKKSLYSKNNNFTTKLSKASQNNLSKGSMDLTNNSIPMNNSTSITKMQNNISGIKNYNDSLYSNNQPVREGNIIKLNCMDSPVNNKKTEAKQFGNSPKSNEKKNKIEEESVFLNKMM